MPSLRAVRRGLGRREWPGVNDVDPPCQLLEATGNDAVVERKGARASECSVRNPPAPASKRRSNLNRWW